MFEKTALQITGASFFLLTAGLIAGNLIFGSTPKSTRWGMVISLISIVVLTVLVALKLRVGRALHSALVIADANCTKACIAMSLTLLVSSLIYALSGFGYLDSIGALSIAWFASSEGREAFEKAADSRDSGPASRV